MKINKITFKLLYLLPGVLVLIYAATVIPPQIAYLNAQQEWIFKIEEILRTRTTEISLSKVNISRPDRPCYVTQSKQEISEVVTALRDVRKKFLAERVKIDRLVLGLAFEDGSHARFTIYRRSHDPSQAHLEYFTYENNSTGQRIESDIQLTFPRVGAWIATITTANSCT